MRKRILFSCLFLPLVAIFTHLPVYAQQGPIDRQLFYAALSSENITTLETQLFRVRTSTDDDKLALEGALLMRQAGQAAGANKKLKLFKDGRSKLEAGISKEPDNAEYRFLRLLIQEHAPGIVKYSKNISQDKEIIKKSYKKLPQAVQTAIATYSKTSKALRPEDL